MRSREGGVGQEKEDTVEVRTSDVAVLGKEQVLPKTDLYEILSV